LLRGEPADVSVPRIVTAGVALTAVDQSAKRVAQNSSLIRAVRVALRDNGFRVTGATLARSAELTGHVALGFHVFFAMKDGRQAYNACIEY